MRLYAMNLRKILRTVNNGIIARCSSVRFSLPTLQSINFQDNGIELAYYQILCSECPTNAKNTLTHWLLPFNGQVADNQSILWRGLWTAKIKGLL